MPEEQEILKKAGTEGGVAKPATEAGGRILIVVCPNHGALNPTDEAEREVL